MDIVFTDREKEIIEEYKKDPSNMILLPPETKRCTIEFDITDIAKFEVFAERLFHDRNQDKLREQCGCTFAALHLNSISQEFSELKQQILDVLSKY